jgi:uncharacterized protein YceK
MRLALLALVLAAMPLLSGCAAVVGGVAGAAIVHEYDREHYYHRGFYDHYYWER